MPLVPIKLRPGVNTQLTPLLLEAGWASTNLVRFHDGLIQKLGGWAHLNQTALIGIGRGSHAWADLTGIPYYAVGTDQRLQIFTGGNVYDITPLRQTDDVTVAFSTTIGSPIVKITDTAFGGNVGDWVFIPIPVSVGGLIIQGFYQIAVVIDGNNYEITASASATANVTAGGAVPEFTTTATSANVEVTLNNHGLAAGNFFGVQVQTSVGGIVIPVSSYQVLASPAPTTNTFFITPAGAAVSSTSVFENGGDVRLEYLVPTGLASETPVSGYGVGTYGSGLYGGSSTGTAIAPLRQWFLDNWGQDLIGNYTSSPIYVWTPPVTIVPSTNQANVAIAINITNFPSAASPPQTVNESFVAMPEQIMVALGCDPNGGGTQDPNLIRWSDVADFTDWVPTAVNQAGSFRLPTGSMIVGALQGPQFGYIWTDVDFWLMQYIGFPLVFGFTKVASGCELLSSHAAGIYNSAAYWPSTENFFVFDGNSVQVLPCTVWDKFFYNYNSQQTQKIWCWVNSAFNEIWWFYPSLNSNEVDSYVKYQTVDRAWDYGMMVRTTGVDTSPFGKPMSVDTSGLIQQHEISNDADGQALVCTATTGWFSLQDGSYFTFVERLLPDFILTGGTQPNNTVQITVQTRNYPNDNIVTWPTQTWSPQVPPYQIVRARGRECNVTVASASLGTFWRFGEPRFLQQPAGRR